MIDALHWHLDFSELIISKASTAVDVVGATTCCKKVVNTMFSNLNVTATLSADHAKGIDLLVVTHTPMTQIWPIW